MDRGRQRIRKRKVKQQKHIDEHPGEFLVFGEGTAAVTNVWLHTLPEGRKSRRPGFYVTGKDAKPAFPADQP
jgi:hypothetical protein